MGKVTVFCLISGCTPEIASNLQGYPDHYADNYDEDLNSEEAGNESGDNSEDESQGELGPLVSQAIKELAEDEEGINDVSVIGDFTKATEQEAGAGPPRSEALRIPDSQVTVRRHCKTGEWWDFGSVEGPAPQHGGDSYLVSFGVLIMVQDFALPILQLATRGRVTPQRLWRLAMHQGRSDMTSKNHYGLDDVDYGEIHHEMEQFPMPISGMKCKEVKKLDRLGDVHAIKKALMHQGGYWMWMRADRFPLEDTAEQPIPSSAWPEMRSSNPNSSAIEALPLELLHMIALEGPLTSILSLASTSRAMRFMLLGSEANQNTLAGAWITKNAPWFAPATSDTEHRYEMHKVRDAWAYLQRCCASASMRNRARIWKVAEQIEDVAEESDI